MINLPDRRYPGPGRPPTASDQARYMRSVDALQQANPSDGGTVGIGIDAGGTQLRDWSTQTILAVITGHGTRNSYAWKEVFLSGSTGLFEDVPNGLTGTTDINPAFEINQRFDVDIGTRVELWPNYGPEPYWTFVFGGLVGTSGSGILGGDLITVQFDALSDVTGSVDLDIQVACVDGQVVVTVATATLNLTKTWERIRITGPDLSITTQCDVGEACQ